MWAERKGYFMFDRIATLVEETFLGFTLLFATLLLFCGVVLRYFFNYAFEWSDELIRYVIIWSTFVGAGLCAKKGMHVKMDILLRIMPVGFLRYWNIFLTLVALLFSLFCMWQGYRMVILTQAFGRTGVSFPLPMWIAYLAVPFGYTLMFIHFLISLFRQWMAKEKVLLEGDMDLVGVEQKGEEK
jgi:C4-dicarboxylate transporter DctQ subunit